MICRAIFIVTTVCLFSMIAFAAYDQRTLYRLLFQDGESCLETEKTLELLKEYKYYDPRVLSLINVSDEHEKKCSFYNTKEIVKLLEPYPKDSVTIRSYKQYHWVQRISACKEHWKKTLEDEVKKLTDDEIKLSNSLKNSIKKNHQHFTYKYRIRIGNSGYFMDSILSYFEENVGHNLEQVIRGDNHKQLYASEYSRLFTKLFRSVHDKLRSSMNIYDMFRDHPETMVDKDEFVLNWLENYNLCRQLEDDMVGRSKVFEKFLKSKNTKPIGKKILDCFDRFCK